MNYLHQERQLRKGLISFKVARTKSNTENFGSIAQIKMQTSQMGHIRRGTVVTSGADPVVLSF